MAKRAKKPSKDGYDEICQFCKNVEKCLFPCAPLKWIDGKTGRKEGLFFDNPERTVIDEDYNAVLHRVMRAKEQDHAKRIREIPDKKIRAIAAMLNVNLSVEDIATIFKLTPRSIYYAVENFTKK